MLFKNITVLDEHFFPINNCFVGIKGRHIAYIGTEMPKEIYGRIYDGTGKILMSGFVNTHAHTPMMYMRGYGGGLHLQNWLNQKIFPFESKMTGEDVYWGTLMGMAESLRFGITSTTDMYYHGEAVAEAMLSAGTKGNLSVPVLCFTDEEYGRLPAYQEMQRLIQQYHRAGNGKLRMDMSIHGEYTSTPQVVEQCSAVCKEWGVHMHLHLSETKSEQEACKKRHGQTPAAYFNSLGTFVNPTTAAHCVWLEGDDFDLLAENGVTVASCPVSNLKLASGVANVPRMLKKGIPVTIGTDGVSSNNNLNMLEDMKMLALIQNGVTGDPQAIRTKEVWQAATIVGARSQGRMDTGAIRVGHLADLMVMDLRGIHMNPVHDLLENLLYAGVGSDVLLTMVDGTVLYENGEFPTIDIEKVLYEVKTVTSRILGEQE